jgi:hypothetical protein
VWYNISVTWYTSVLCTSSLSQPCYDVWNLRMCNRACSCDLCFVTYLLPSSRLCHRVCVSFLRLWLVRSKFLSYILLHLVLSNKWISIFL